MEDIDSPNLYSFVAWQPHMATDPQGLWIEDLVFGVPSLGLGYYSFRSNVKAGEAGMAAIDVFGMVVDVAAIAIPGMPGGAGAAIKAGRAASALNKARRAVKFAEFIDQSVNVGQGLYQAGGAFGEGDILGGSLNLAMSGLGLKRLNVNPWKVVPSSRAGLGLGSAGLRYSDEVEDLLGTHGFRVTTARGIGSYEDIHHIATVESRFWRRRFKPLFAGADIDLQDPLNKIRIPGHVGPHGYYNAVVYERLRRAVAGLAPQTAEYSARFQRELFRIRRELADPASALRGVVTSAATKAEIRASMRGF